MLRRYDYKCISCGLLEEHWVTSSDKYTTCRDCGDTAMRIISPISTKFEGVGWPDADDKWARDHESAARK
jgi:putative FmdB family regulatory protein